MYYKPATQRLTPTFNEDNCYNVLVFDTETTTVGRSAEIIQIAATTTEDQDAQTFSQYIKPNTLITKAALNIHGIQSFIVNGEKVMYRDSVPIAGRTKLNVRRVFDNRMFDGFC